MFDEYGEEQVKQAKEESARNLKLLCVLTDEQIASVTGLSLERIETLS